MSFSALRAIVAGVFSCLVLHAASAQESPTYPTKSIRLVVTFPPGGASDSMVRLVLPRLSERLGQPVIVDNKPGAGGNVGLSLVAKASPDGYTLGLGAAGGLAANVNLYAQMPFDPAKDFAPVGMLALTPFVLVGNPSVPARSLKELVALAKAKPGAVTVGHGGNGTGMHLSAAMLEQMAGIDLNAVPYRGNGPATQDVLGGQLALAMIDLPASLQHIKAGKLIPYGVTSAKRLPMLPGVPTVAEAGVPGYDSVGWFGVVAPAGTPAAIVARFNTALNAALADEQVKAAMRDLGAESAPGTPQSFQSFITDETLKLGKVIKAANIKVE